MMRKFITPNQTRGLRQIQSVPISADNQQLNFDLPRGPHLEYAALRVGGTINVGTLFAGGARNAAPYLYLRNLQWVINSNVTLDAVSGIQIAAGYFTRRLAPAVTTPLAAAGATSFEATYFLDRTLMDMMRPKDSYLKTDVGMSNNQLRVQLGALADMYGAGAGAATYTAVSASLFVSDYQEARDDAGNTPAPSYYVKRTGQRVALPASGSGQQIKLSTGNRLRAISIRVLNASTLEPDVSLLTRVGLRRAGDTRVDMLTTDMLRINGASYGVPNLTGQVIVDLANPGSLGVKYSEFWPIPSSADTFLIVDTSAACVLDLMILEGVDLTKPA